MGMPVEDRINDSGLTVKKPTRMGACQGLDLRTVMTGGGLLATILR
jgi:hypothetical protein